MVTVRREPGASSVASDAPQLSQNRALCRFPCPQVGQDVITGSLCLDRCSWNHSFGTAVSLRWILLGRLSCTEEREVLTLEPMADAPEVGRWLSAMEDGRRDTLRELDGVPEDMIDVRPLHGENSIGSTLYHVALIEADWLFDDTSGIRLGDSELSAWFPFTDRDPEGQLTHVEGESLAATLRCSRRSFGRSCSIGSVLCRSMTSTRREHASDTTFPRHGSSTISSSMSLSIARRSGG